MFQFSSITAHYFAFLFHRPKKILAMMKKYGCTVTCLTDVFPPEPKTDQEK